MFFVYILRCEDDSLYTGFTDDIKKRISAHYHRLKTAAKYTKSHKVTSLASLWNCESQTGARKLEYRIKRLKREQKLMLIENPKRVSEFFPELAEFDISPNTEIKFNDCI